MKFTKVQTPRGAKDILPPEGYKKSRIEAQAAASMERWGYRRVYTPTFEFYDALAQGSGPEIADTLYRFVDRDGHTLALRPEMTIPIARMVATRYTADEMPLRLYYIGNVFRYDDPQAGRQREFTQVGVELIGLGQPAADAEIVALAVTSLEELGLRSFRVDLGHVGYIHALLEATGDDALAGALKQALLQRDYVRFEEVVQTDRLGGDLKEALLALPTLRGGVEAIDAAREVSAPFPDALAALDELQRIYELVDAYGLAGNVAIDLGIIKGFDYYTGFLMEGYTPELGFTLCGGGRYDALVGRFGTPTPATGFAFGVERAMLALERQGWHLQEESADLFLYSEEGPEVLFRAAADLRAQGQRVELGIGCSDRSSATGQAVRRGISTLGLARCGEDGTITVVQSRIEDGVAAADDATPTQRVEGETSAQSTPGQGRVLS